LSIGIVWIVVVRYWSISSEWQVAPPSCK